MVKWEVEVVEIKDTKISKEEFDQRLEELLNVLLRKEGAFSIAQISTDGFAPQSEEIA